MKYRGLLIFTLFLLGGISPLFSQYTDYKIVITTPGYTSIYRYDPWDVQEGVKKDFRLDSVAVEWEDLNEKETKIKLQLDRRSYDFRVNMDSPVVRLRYDRNRRLFLPMGSNLIEENTAYTLPSFKGKSPAELPALWLADIEKKIEDRNLLNEDEPNLFILELDIDEHGIVNRIEEISGALKQYSQFFIDKVYDVAVRGWQPATCNGQPVRSLAHLVFKIDR